MNRNPITPYILIMLIGIVAVFFISMKGLGDKHDLAVERGDIEEDVTTAEFDPEVQSKSCISCHGDNLEGGMGPALVGTDLEVDEIEEIIINGKGAMPPGLVEPEHVTEFAEWLKSLE